jgi:hypothetical protein
LLPSVGFHKRPAPAIDARARHLAQFLGEIWESGKETRDELVYKTHPLTADPGQTVRFWVVHAGPRLNTEFHIQTAVVPAGGGVFDVKIDQPGLYPFVSHSFASVMLGEVGLLNVGNVKGTMNH